MTVSKVVKGESVRSRVEEGVRFVVGNVVCSGRVEKDQQDVDVGIDEGEAVKVVEGERERELVPVDRSQSVG